MTEEKQGRHGAPCNRKTPRQKVLLSCLPQTFPNPFKTDEEDEDDAGGLEARALLGWWKEGLGCPRKTLVIMRNPFYFITKWEEETSWIPENDE